MKSLFWAFISSLSSVLEHFFLLSFILFCFLVIFYHVIIVVSYSFLCPPPPSTPLPQAILIPLFVSLVLRIRSLATLFPVLYFTSPWLFCDYQFVLLNPLTHYPKPSSHLATIETLSVSMILFLFLFA